MSREQSLLTRTLRVGSTGKDVEAAKRTTYRYLANGKLKTLATKPDKVRRTFGPLFAIDVVKARRKAGFDNRPIFGPAFFDYLVDKGAPDALAIDLLNQYRADNEISDGQRVANTALWYYRNSAGIRYSQARPIPTISKNIRPPRTPDYLDCSGLAISCYWANSLEQKLGNANALGYGNTWSLANYGTAIRSSQLQPGDLVFYGNCSHVAVYVGDGMVVSHGSYPMRHVNFRYRHDLWGYRRYL